MRAFFLYIVLLFLFTSGCGSQGIVATPDQVVLNPATSDFGLAGEWEVLEELDRGVATGEVLKIEGPSNSGTYTVRSIERSHGGTIETVRVWRVNIEPVPMKEDYWLVELTPIEQIQSDKPVRIVQYLARRGDFLFVACVDSAKLESRLTAKGIDVTVANCWPITSYSAEQGRLREMLLHQPNQLITYTTVLRALRVEKNKNVESDPTETDAVEKSKQKPVPLKVEISEYRSINEEESQRFVHLTGFLGQSETPPYISLLLKRLRKEGICNDTFTAGPGCSVRVREKDLERAKQILEEVLASKQKLSDESKSLRYMHLASFLGKDKSKASRRFPELIMRLKAEEIHFGPGPGFSIHVFEKDLERAKEILKEVEAGKVIVPDVSLQTLRNAGYVIQGRDPCEGTGLCCELLPAKREAEVYYITLPNSEWQSDDVQLMRQFPNLKQIRADRTVTESEYAILKEIAPIGCTVIVSGDIVNSCG